MCRLPPLFITAAWFWQTSEAHRRIWFDVQSPEERQRMGEQYPALRFWMAQQHFGTQNPKDAVDRMWQDRARFEATLRAEIEMSDSEN